MFELRGSLLECHSRGVASPRKGKPLQIPHVPLDPIRVLTLLSLGSQPCCSSSFHPRPVPLGPQDLAHLTPRMEWGSQGELGL